MTSRPNFVFILADDLGVMDLGAGGSRYYESPNIDRIAHEGMIFEQGYAACQVCSPSRASILTGKYTPRHGITEYIGGPSGTDWKRNTRLLPPAYARQLAHRETTLATALREGGYRTFFGGKWHLGGPGHWPQDHGFEVNVGGWDAGGPKGGYFTPYENPNLADGPPGECLCTRLGRETAAWIEEHREEPFLAYLSFYAVHAPIQTTRDYWRHFRDKAVAAGHEGPRFAVDRTLPVRLVQDNPIYAGLIKMMDDGVGLVLDTLDNLGLAENTVVVFTSDNGGVVSGDAYSSCQFPFRGGKGRQWEGGIREPWYVRAPGIVAPGSRCTTPVIGMDFYPTFLELAGLDARPEQHCDGVSTVPLLTGGRLPARDLFWHYPHYANQGGEPCSIVRAGDWKLIHYWEDGRDELYDLAGDLAETTDRAADQPDRVARLRARLDAWLAETGAREPVPNPNFDPEAAAAEAERNRTEWLATLEQRHAELLGETFQPNPDWWGSTLD